MLKNGYIINYKEKLRDIEELDFGDEFLEKYMKFYVLEYIYNCLIEEDRGKEIIYFLSFMWFMIINLYMFSILICI